MASLKAMKYETALLSHVGSLKQMALKNLDSKPDAQQEILTEINNFFKTAHEEGRRLRKALAFLHAANDSLKKQLTDSEIEPDEMYGREADGQSFGS